MPNRASVHAPTAVARIFCAVFSTHTCSVMHPFSPHVVSAAPVVSSLIVATAIFGEVSPFASLAGLRIRHLSVSRNDKVATTSQTLLRAR